MEDPSVGWLLAQGYRVEALEASGGFVCLIQDDVERWIAWGPTAEEAFAHVLAQMFPSRAARALLAQAAAPGEAVRVPGSAVRSDARAQDVSAAQPAPDASEAMPDVIAELPIARASASEAGAAQPAPDASEAMPDVIAELPIARASASEAGAAQPASDATATPTTPITEPPDARASATGANDVDEIRSELAALADRIEAARPELALMAPELQRLHMTAWICRGRTLEQARPGDADVHRAIAAIAALLTEIAKLWWPGTVIALQLQATPREVVASLGLGHGRDVRTWADAAMAAEACARRVLDHYASRGLDDDGWADTAQLNPSPPSAAPVLAEARNEIESVLGSIDAHPELAARDGLAADLDVQGAQLTLSAARKLRWTRHSAPTPELWARALGRLRWATRQRVDGVEALRELLDPAYVPPQPWASVLGRDPIAMERRRRRKALLRAVPAPGSERETVMAWLVRAFDVGGDELPMERIARHAAPFAATVAEIDASTLASISRKKLGKLRRHLGLIDIEAAADDARESVEAAEPESPRASLPDPQEALARALRSAIAGHRALFVSNRTDPELHKSLQELLGLDLAWCESDVRRIQSACERIGRGSYDLVLCATGFSDHAVDALLYRAAQSAGVRYCRVGTGRPHTCVRALATQFGLSAVVSASHARAKPNTLDATATLSRVGPPR